jgi:hypothetical protein
MGNAAESPRAAWTTGQAGAADAAADSAGATVPSRDYRPDGAADGLSRSKPRDSESALHAKGPTRPGPGAMLDYERFSF